MRTGGCQVERDNQQVDNTAYIPLNKNIFYLKL